MSIPSLDLVFAVDGSNVLSSTQFNKVKDSIKKILDFYTISRTATNVGVIEFSDRSRDVIGLTDSYDKDEIKSLIDGFTQSRGNRRVTDEAIRMASSRMFEMSGRVGASRALIIFIAGKSSGSQPLRGTIKPLRKKGVRIYVVSVGDGVDKDEIDSLVADPRHEFPTSVDRPDEVVTTLAEAVKQDVKKRK